MIWPFNKKPIQIAQPLNDRREDDNLPIIPQEKSFDWAHYQSVANGGINAGYQDEYNFIPTVRVLKSLYAREPWISFCMNAIARQFMSTKHVIAFTGPAGEEQIIKSHPLISFLSTAGKENPSFFTSNNVVDLLLTGNAYVWLSPDLKDKKRLPSDRVDLKFNQGVLTSYQVTNPEGEAQGQGASSLTLSPEEVLHFMMPNPYSSYVGMSILMAVTLPILIDKYGREFIIGFFMRGGHTAGVIQTDATNADQLTRLVKSIMQAIGGRRNAHADKVLPKGAQWTSSGTSFSDIQLTEILKDNQTMFRAATGVTNTILGIADGVNRATAMAEMEHFWKMTILPTQNIYCAAIKHSSLWRRFGLDDRYELRFDNSKVDYLDDFTRKLDDDTKLKAVATVNERRTRLGFVAMERLGDQFESEMAPAASTSPFTFSINQEDVAVKELEAGVNSSGDLGEIAKIKADLPKLQEPSIRAESYFQREFARWEDITLANMKDLEKAKEIIVKRSKDFCEGLSDILVKEMIRIYDYHINRLKKSKSFRRTKDSSTDKDRIEKLDQLRERGVRVLKGIAFKNAEIAFKGYSENNMTRIHKNIADSLESGMSIDDAAGQVRKDFGEFYEGQAKTIVRTEFASAMSEASYQFGNDLATISKKMSKTWLAMGDEHTRPDHLALDQKSLSGNAEDVPDMYFESGDTSLRYPKDESGEAKDVINCRCDLLWDVVEWE